MNIGFCLMLAKDCNVTEDEIKKFLKSNSCSNCLEYDFMLWLKKKRHKKETKATKIRKRLRRLVDRIVKKG